MTAPAIHAVLALAAACVCLGDDDHSRYGSVSPERYLTGRFSPNRHEYFVCLNDLGIPTSPGRHYLRREAAAALRDLYRDFRKAHPTAPFWVQSSTRTYEDQKYIWEAKWNGTVMVNGKRLNAVKDPTARAREILAYSSMPGTSRHHWGTDVDFNVLNDAYFTSGGGRLLYLWLRGNAERYGFCQPYTAGRRSGYREEKWHWSYLPLARRFLADWNERYRTNPRAFISEGSFSAAAQVGGFAAEYVNSISDECR